MSESLLPAAIPQSLGKASCMISTAMRGEGSRGQAVLHKWWKEDQEEDSMGLAPRKTFSPWQELKQLGQNILIAYLVWRTSIPLNYRKREHSCSDCTSELKYVFSFQWQDPEERCLVDTWGHCELCGSFRWNVKLMHFSIPALRTFALSFFLDVTSSMSQSPLYSDKENKVVPPMWRLPM